MYGYLWFLFLLLTYQLLIWLYQITSYQVPIECLLIGSPSLNFISLSTWSDILYSISQQFGFCHFLCQSHHLDSSPNHIILKSAPFLVRSFPLYSLPYQIGSLTLYSESIQLWSYPYLFYLLVTICMATFGFPPQLLAYQLLIFLSRFQYLLVVSISCYIKSPPIKSPSF